jgi:dTDP-4-dehydrorhamnose reductase
LNLRCSVIGNELNSSLGLRCWLLSHASAQTVNGFSNHLWNGVTTLSFSRIISGILKNDNFFAGTAHIVPVDYVSKFELLKLIAEYAGRNDLFIRKYEASTDIDRRLVTNNEGLNAKLWIEAGYASIPTVEQIIKEFEHSR